MLDLFFSARPPRPCLSIKKGQVIFLPTKKEKNALKCKAERQFLDYYYNRDDPIEPGVRFWLYLTERARPYLDEISQPGAYEIVSGDDQN